MKFSFYRKGIKVTKPSSSISIVDAIELIKGNTYAMAVEKIRTIENRDVAKVLKNNLDYFTFSGEFKTRLEGNLIKHSGYLCLDFDKLENMEETKLQISFDPHTLAVFVSPSGNGLKVILIIDAKKHLDSFIDASLYFQQQYNLIADLSGKDVCRACFLSYDPTAYLNTGAIIYKIKGLKPKKTVQPESPKKVEYKRNSDIEALEIIVKRIEDAKTDLTNGDYSRWLMMAFSMATYGEEGRSYFHRISCFNDKYNEEDANTKFSNAVKTTRFQTPSIFYKWAKEAGIDISNDRADKQVTIKEKLVKNKKNTKEGEPRNAKTKEAPPKVHYGFGTSISYDDDGIYYWSGKGYKRIATGFHIHIEYQSKDEQDNTSWIINVVTLVSKKNISFELTNEDFNTANSWKRKLSENSLSFKLTDVMLTELIDYLFIENTHKFSTKILRYGWHHESQTWLFANIGFDGNKLIEPDKHGIIDSNNMHISLPQIRGSKESSFFYTKTDLRFNEWYIQYQNAYPKQSFMLACYYIFSVFMDISKEYKNMNLNPILYIKGRANSGKTTMIELLGTLFGFVQQNTSLKGNPTPRAVQKMLSNTQNGFLHADEYHNNPIYANFFVSAFNFKGYDLTPDDRKNAIEHQTIPVTRGIVLTSNEEPTYEPFVTRLIYMVKDDITKNLEEKKAHDTLQDWAKEGCASISIEILKHRKLVEQKYGECFLELWNGINNQLLQKGIEVKTRNINMIVVCLCSAYILQKYGFINIGLESEDPEDVLLDFSTLGATQVLFQHEKQGEKSALAMFFELFQSLYFSKRIFEGSHFRFIEDRSHILIDISSIYPMYQKEFFIINKEMPASKDEIIHALVEMTGKTKEEVVKKTGRFYGELTDVKMILNKTVNCPISVRYDLLVDKFGINFEATN